ncbi:MAG: hypothetical protein ACYC0X_33085 [Pirellulaceae bacterium]
MPVRSIPHTLILLACALRVASGQDLNTNRSSVQRQGPARIPPVALRVEEDQRSAYDPPPVPPAELVSHATTASRTQEHSADSMPMWTESTPDAACAQCGGACRNSNHASHGCPPSRWNVIGRMGYCWKTRTKPCLQASHWGYPEEFCERPFGSYVRANLCAQVANGLQDQLILYRYDFFDESLADGYQLKPRGLYELAKIIALVQEKPLLRDGFNAICVEETGNSQLDEARRQYVLQQLALMHFPLPSEQVIIGRPAAPGISGEESLMVYANLIKLWESGNQGGGSGQGQGGTFGGAGLGLGPAGAGSTGR